MTFNLRRFLRFQRDWLVRTPWSPRRAAVTLAYVVAFPLVELAVWSGLLADELLFRGYRRQPVRTPLFVVGNPRSGTTFLHRLLAADRERFTTMTLGEVVFAPSVLQRRLAAAAVRLDCRLGRPLARLDAWLERRWGAWNPMHETGLTAPEEDDYLLLHVWSALAVGLSSGQLDEAREFTFFDTAVPEAERRRLMAFYRRCVQRHLYAHRGGGATYLAKNPSLAPKLASLFEELPDARVVYIARDPLEMVPSYLSLMRFTWRTVGLPAEDPALTDYLLEMAGHWYRYPLEVLASRPHGSYAILTYDELQRDPEAAVRRIYAELRLELGAAYARRLAAEAERARGFRSRHGYDLEGLGLDRERLLADFADVLERFDFASAARL